MEPKKNPKKSYRVGGRDLKELLNIPPPRVWKQQILPLKMGNMLFSKTIARKSPGYWVFLVFFLPELRRFEAKRGGKNSFFSHI